MDRLVFGILAHVDAGKTTLAEAMRSLPGGIRRRGRGDHADAFLDTDALERERGITIFSKPAALTLGDLEGQLDSRFYRAGRSVIVNLTRISRVTKAEIRLSDGTSIPLPRGAYEGVNRAIINLR